MIIPDEYSKEARLAAIVEASADAIISLSLEDLIVTWNRGATEFYGYRADEVIGRPFADLVPEEGREERRNLLSRIARGERLAPVQTMRRHRDGRILEVSATLSLLEGSSAGGGGVVEVARAISTPRLGTQEEYRLLFQNNPHPMWVYDLVTLRYLAVNTAAIFHYGYSEAEFLTMTISDIRPEEDLPRLREALPEIREGGKSFGHWRHRRRDGSLIEVDVSSDAIVFQGRLARLVLATDVTERQRTAEELRAREFFLSNAQRVARLGTWEMDATGNHVVWSDETYRIFGISREEFGHSFEAFLNLVHPEDRDWIVAKYANPSPENAVVEGEYRIIRPDGEERVVYERGEIAFDAGGQAIRQVGVVMDITPLKETEQALQASEREFRTLAESMPQIVWISVPDKGNVYSNHRWTDYTGLTQEETRGYGWRKAYHPDDHARVEKAWERARETGQIYAIECRLRRADGSYRWWLSRAVPQRDVDGKIVKWFGTSTDIDDLKQAEEALSEKESLLRITGSTAKLGGWSVDLADGHLVWSDEIYRIFELPLDTPLSVDLAINLYAPESRDVIRRAVNDCATLGRPYDMEVAVVTAKGKRLWARTIGQAERDAEGRIWRLHGAFQDVTERKLAAEALRASAQRLEMAAKAGGMGVWELDLVSQEVTSDEQMLKLYGLEASVARDFRARWREALHPDDRQRTDYELEDAIQGGRPFDTEFRIHRVNDHALRFLRGTATVVRDEVGRPTRLIGLNWDVTDQHIREERLAESLAHERELARQAQAGERAKSEFLAVMSHEIRTPMNGILGFAEILSHEASLSSDAKSYVQTIAGSGEALLRILDDILDFSRLDAGRVMIEKRVFNPAALVRDIEALFRNQIQERGLSFHVSIAPEIPLQVKGDAGRIRQILVNLTGNAMKFTDNGSITLRADVSEDNLEFSVRDTGVGIPENKQAAIFEPFTQADSANSRRKGGTGLGLTISRRLAELMGGGIRLESEVGEGSVFFLSMPLEEAGSTGTAAELGLPVLLDTGFAVRHPLRLMVVEDDKVNLKLILTMVCKLGYEPVMALNGTEAVEVFRRERPDCILMDVQMPEMDGIEATREIRKLERELDWPPVYISALTANILPEDQRRCFDAGINFYLNKPVKSQAVADVLIEACSHRARVNTSNRK